MQHSDQLEAVRNLVRETMQSAGVTGLDDCFEKILLRDGYYCGRSFSCGGHRAVWFIEEQTVKFYSPDGGFRCASSVEPKEANATRRAA